MLTWALQQNSATATSTAKERPQRSTWQKERNFNTDRKRCSRSRSHDDIQGGFFCCSALKMTKCKTHWKIWHLELFWWDFLCRRTNKVPNSAKYQILGYLDIWQGALNMAKWGIPEKSTKNAAQTGRPEVRRTLQSKVITKNRFSGISPWALKMGGPMKLMGQ